MEEPTLDMNQVVDKIDQVISHVKETDRVIADAVAEIQRMFNDYIREHIHAVQKGWRHEWTAQDRRNAELAAVRAWRSEHPALLALWEHHQKEA